MQVLVAKRIHLWSTFSPSFSAAATAISILASGSSFLWRRQRQLPTAMTMADSVTSQPANRKTCMYWWVVSNRRPGGGERGHRDTLEDRIGSSYLRPDDVGDPVEDHGEAEQVDAAGPHPLQARYEPRRGPGEHVHEAQDGEQQSGRGVLVTQAFSVADHEHRGHEQAQHHDGRRHGVDEEAPVLEHAEVQELLLGRGLLLLCSGGRGFLQLLRGNQGPHQGPAGTAVEEDASQDEEAPPPAIVVLEDLTQGGEAAQRHRAAGRRQPVGQRPLLTEVAIQHDEGGLEVQRQTQT
ncbi:hypothetical protein EYF80_039174 [Liparis tanakae]|uniref:Uncharacterized protein n=1 Tax=Liparis tanakae TaxID=230148 RepID=A0A4Z2GBI4_9TELE|nr:hypothetical protein EYF80_039174 [Liparis tanakae]